MHNCIQILYSSGPLTNLTNSPPVCVGAPLFSVGSDCFMVSNTFQIQGYINHKLSVIY